MGTFNAERYTTEVLGGRITEVLEDGRFKFSSPDLETGQEIEQTFNLPGFLQSENVDPETDIKFNSPETAFTDDNPIGFGLGTKLSVTRTNEDKLRLLEQEFGEDNVVVVGDQISVKEGNVWKQADASFISSIAAETPIIAAATAGAIGGAKAGAAIGLIGGPVGSAVGGFIGGVFGGAASAAVARWAQIEDAENMGIRTEQDAVALQQELGKEFTSSAVWGFGVPVAGKILKPLAAPLRRATKALLDKTGIAATAQKLFPGTQLSDWRTVVRSEADTKAVLKNMEDVIQHEIALSKGIAKTTTDPATAKIIKITDKSMESFKKSASKRFQKSLDELDEVFKGTEVNIADDFLDFQRSLAEEGLIDPSTQKFLTKIESAKLEQIETVFDARSRRTLKDVHDVMRKAFDKNQVISFKDARKIRNNIDDILENSGFFKGGDLAIQNQARRQLKRLAGRLTGKLEMSLGTKTIIRNGEQIRASVVFNGANSNYTKFRTTFDDFALPSRLGGTAQQKALTVERMLGDKGAAMEDTFGEMATAAGGDGPRILQELQRLKAAKNLSPIYSPAVTGKAATIGGVLFGGPRTGARIVGQNLRPLSEAISGTARVSKQTLSGVKGMGSAVNFYNRLSPKDKQLLLSNPIALRELFGIATQGPLIHRNALEEATGRR